MPARATPRNVTKSRVSGFAGRRHTLYFNTLQNLTLVMPLEATFAVGGSHSNTLRSESSRPLIALGLFSLRYKRASAIKRASAGVSLGGRSPERSATTPASSAIKLSWQWVLFCGAWQADFTKRQYCCRVHTASYVGQWVSLDLILAPDNSLLGCASGLHHLGCRRVDGFWGRRNRDLLLFGGSLFCSCAVGTVEIHLCARPDFS